MHYCSAVRDSKKIPVAMRSRETPVPIPNTTVKTRAAESTMLETVWEDRWLPDLKRRQRFSSDEGTEDFRFLMAGKTVKRIYDDSEYTLVRSTCC